LRLSYLKLYSFSSTVALSQLEYSTNK
jgi:hypothetical protein